MGFYGVIMKHRQGRARMMLLAQDVPAPGARLWKRAGHGELHWPCALWAVQMLFLISEFRPWWQGRTAVVMLLLPVWLAVHMHVSR